MSHVRLLTDSLRSHHIFWYILFVIFICFVSNIWWYIYVIIFQVVMQPGQTQEEGMKIADDLKTKLGIKETDLLSGAYMDLILKQTQNGEQS